jgi:hypothetical protein
MDVKGLSGVEAFSVSNPFGAVLKRHFMCRRNAIGNVQE